MIHPQSSRPGLGLLELVVQNRCRKLQFNKKVSMVCFVSISCLHNYVIERQLRHCKTDDVVIFSAKPPVQTKGNAY